MVEVKNLTKVYKLSKRQMKKEKAQNKLVTAVNQISFQARSGEIYGLLGPNGAGKTTTLRCMSTLLRPTEGSVTVEGFDTISDATQVRSRIAFLTNEIKLDPHFSVDYMFDFFAALYNMDAVKTEQRKEMLFEYFEIGEFRKKKIEELSTGMKQKAAIAISLAHDPSIIIFDEPTSGLDILTARLVLDYLKKLKEEGKLIIISTHIMTEAEKLCDRVGIIIDGRMVCDAALEQIYMTYQMDNLEDVFFELYQNTRG
ncbi:MAG: ABC transporter ATP-binding protein [Lachnospiraceae bacterium]